MLFELLAKWLLTYLDKNILKEGRIKMILLFLFFISEHGEEMSEGTEDEFAKNTSSFMKRDQNIS